LSASGLYSAKIYRVATNSQDKSPFSSSKPSYKTDRQSAFGTAPSSNRWKGLQIIYHEKSTTPNMYGSQVELAELEPGRIYKTEEISVTSARKADSSEAKR
jgi:hypothetical protein